MNFEELRTVIVQIENMVNTRPFTYLSDKNCYEHITPSYLMYGRNINRRNTIDGNDDIIILLTLLYISLYYLITLLY